MFDAETADLIVIRGQLANDLHCWMMHTPLHRLLLVQNAKAYMRGRMDSCVALLANQRRVSARGTSDWDE